MQISSKCSIAIHCLLFIHVYSAHTKVTGDLIATSVKSNVVTIRNILSALKKEGILEIPAGSGGATIAAPLKEITLYRICQAVEPDFSRKMIGIHKNPSANCPVGSRIHDILEISYEKVRNDMIISLSQITMEDVVKDYQSDCKA